MTALKNLSNDNDLCNTDNCSLECNLFAYDINEYSYRTPSTGNLTDISPKNFDGLNTYENVSKTYFVYYQDFKYIFITQQPKIEIFGLISN